MFVLAKGKSEVFTEYFKLRDHWKTHQEKGTFKCVVLVERANGMEECGRGIE